MSSRSSQPKKNSNNKHSNEWCACVSFIFCLITFDAFNSNKSSWNAMTHWAFTRHENWISNETERTQIMWKSFNRDLSSMNCNRRSSFSCFFVLFYCTHECSVLEVKFANGSNKHLPIFFASFVYIRILAVAQAHSIIDEMISVKTVFFFARHNIEDSLAEFLCITYCQSIKMYEKKRIRRSGMQGVNICLIIHLLNILAQVCKLWRF